MASSTLCASAPPWQRCTAAPGRSTASVLSPRHHVGNAANMQPASYTSHRFTACECTGKGHHVGVVLSLPRWLLLSALWF